METSTWVIIAIVAIIALLYDSWKKSYFKRRGIPTDRVLPFIGHYHTFIIKGLVQAVVDADKKYGKTFGLLFGSSPIIVTSDPDMLKEVLIRDFSHFYNRRGEVIEDYPMNKSLVRLEGARWKKVRNTLTPAFSANKMKPIAALLNESCDILVRNMKAALATNPEMEVKAVYGNLTMDTIAKAGFGIQVDSQENPNSPFVKHAKEIIHISFLRPSFLLAVFIPQLAPILNYFKIGISSSSAKQFFMDVTHQALQMREDQGSKRVDLLQLMVNARSSDELGSESTEIIPELAGEEDKNQHQSSKAELTEGEIMAQALVFFLAGYETTNIALSFVSYFLAIHPEMQEKLFQEVQEFAPNRDSVNYNTVGKMEYLDKFLSEALRLYPPGFLADRVCQEDITIKDFHFEKGMSLFYNILALHRDPDLWEDPEKFDPERFTKEAKEKRHPFAYLPFGAGPRNCIGMRFALLVLKVAIVRVVQNFKFEPCEKTQIPPKFGKRSVIPDNGITLRVIARE